MVKVHFINLSKSSFVSDYLLMPLDVYSRNELQETRKLELQSLRKLKLYAVSKTHSTNMQVVKIDKLIQEIVLHPNSSRGENGRDPIYA